MQQHVLDDGIGALPVLFDLGEVALQRIHQLADFGVHGIVQMNMIQRLAQFLQQVGRKRRRSYSRSSAGS